jgi:beta-glucosidase/6-phospho-beta-glucosidase/beta-galactosidase
MRWWLGLAALAGCGSEDLSFPKTFLFGSAIAGFQAEMGCPSIPAGQCEDPNSDWYTWITKPELIADPATHLAGDPPTAGPGFFELYQQDLDRAANELHHNAFRLSIEWSRLFPTATDALSGNDALRAAASPAALAYYHALFEALKQRGLTPLVTLDHYTLPSWIHDAYGCHKDIANCSPRGWLDRQRVQTEMAKYAGFCAAEFGDHVDRWATLNEPFTAVALAGFLAPSDQRTNPPGVSLKIPEAKAAYAAMIEAHARVYDAVHANDSADADGDGVPAKVGIVYNLQAVAPNDPKNMEDVRGSQHLQYLEDQMFLDGVAKGAFDANWDGNPVQRADLENRMDFIGVNYYAKTIAEGTDSSLYPAISPLLDFDFISLGYDYNYAHGIKEVLEFAQQYGVPLVISETGAAQGDDPDGPSRWAVQTLTWVKRAMRAGINVEGYFYWTLTDNYEWNHGMSIRVGIYGVDKNDPSKARQHRNLVDVYARIAQERKIPDDLYSKFPP